VIPGAGLCNISTVLSLLAMRVSNSLARQVIKIVKRASAANAAVVPADGFVTGAVATEVACRWIIPAGFRT
jgi:hypothetical protein